MSNTSIQLKKSGQTGNVPSTLSHGEVAINYADGKLYYKNASNVITYISNQFSFETINVDGSLILATSPTDTLNIKSGNNIYFQVDGLNNRITINANTSSLDQTARDTANSAGSYANAAFLQANAAYNLANTISGGSVDVFARDTANAAFIQANAAFNAANTGGSGTDQTARDTANAAFVQANAAFAVANTVPGTYLDTFKDSFTGTGACTEFTLSSSVYSSNSIIVNINGISQLHSAYTIANDIITFTSAPANNSKIEVQFLTGKVFLDTFSGTGACTVYALAGSTSSNTAIVNINGVLQLSSAYDISGNTLTFTSAPANNATIEIQYVSGSGSTMLTETMEYWDTLTVSNGDRRWYANKNFRIRKVDAFLVTAPTGSSVELRINKNGTQVSNLSILASNTNSSNNLNIPMSYGDYISFDVTQIGSGTPGSKLTMMFTYQ